MPAHHQSMQDSSFKFIESLYREAAEQYRWHLWHAVLFDQKTALRLQLYICMVM